MDKFLELHNLLRLNHEEIENLNSLITSKETETVIKNLHQFWFPRCVCPAVGLLGHMAVLFPVFEGISTLFSIVAVLVCIPTNSVRGFPFLHTLSSIYCFKSFKIFCYLLFLTSYHMSQGLKYIDLHRHVLE